MPNKHALLSPSSAYRWMTCPGSPAMCHGSPDESSEYADQGTAAHQLASMCLVEKRDAVAYKGRRIVVGHRTFEVDDEMCDAVQVYVENIRLYAEGHDLMVEQALPISHITGEDGAEGTGDAIVITAGGEELQLHDLKFGRGVPVSARNNKQLMLYALGALEFVSVLGYTPNRFRLVIHQPRINTAPDEWDCTIEELLAFGEEVKGCAKIALTAYEFRANWLGREGQEQYLQPSTEGCKFCTAKATCPALAKFVQQNVGMDFQVLASPPDDPVAEEQMQIEMNPADHNEDDLATKMRATDLIEDWIRAVRAEVERRLLAAVPVPGFKLVQGRQGARAWSDAEKAEETLKSMRLKQEEMYDFKLISPTTAEKKLKDTPKRWARLQPLISRSEGKPSVAPESDKRPALVIKPAADDFAVVEEGADLV